MTSTAQRLATLSGLSGTSAGAHLLAIRRAGVTAGQILMSRSGLGFGSALQHLMASLSVDQPTVPVCGGSSGRGRIVRIDRVTKPLRKTKQQRQNEQIFMLLL